MQVRVEENARVDVRGRNEGSVGTAGRRRRRNAWSVEFPLARRVLFLCSALTRFPPALVLARGTLYRQLTTRLPEGGIEADGVQHADDLPTVRASTLGVGVDPRTIGRSSARRTPSASRPPLGCEGAVKRDPNGNESEEGNEESDTREERDVREETPVRRR